jgi:hypothetical protein
MNPYMVFRRNSLSKVKMYNLLFCTRYVRCYGLQKDEEFHFRVNNAAYAVESQQTFRSNTFTVEK